MKYNDDQVLYMLCDHLRHKAGYDMDIHVDESLVEQLALDSMKVLNLIMEIEDEFDVTIPINALADINTVRELASTISSLKN